MFEALKDSLAQILLAQSDEQILADAAADGINPDEARSRVLNAFHQAKKKVSGEKPAVLDIDAARARDILKKVASRSRSKAIPLPLAAQLGRVKGEDAIRLVSELKDLGIVSDEELK